MKKDVELLLNEIEKSSVIEFDDLSKTIQQEVNRHKLGNENLVKKVALGLNKFYKSKSQTLDSAELVIKDLKKALILSYEIDEKDILDYISLIVQSQTLERILENPGALDYLENIISSVLIFKLPDHSVLIGYKNSIIQTSINWLNQLNIPLTSMEYLGLLTGRTKAELLMLDGLLDVLKIKEVQEEVLPLPLLSMARLVYGTGLIENSLRPYSETLSDVKNISEAFMINQDEGLNKLLSAGKVRLEGFLGLNEFDALTMLNNWIGLEKNNENKRRKLIIKKSPLGTQLDLEELKKELVVLLQEHRFMIKENIYKQYDEYKKTKVQVKKKNWRQKTIEWALTNSVVYDAGLASYLMFKQGAFVQFNEAVWNQAHASLVETLTRGEKLEVPRLMQDFGILGHEHGIVLSHFIFRYHREGGARSLAQRVFSEFMKKNKEDLILDVQGSLNEKSLFAQLRKNQKATAAISQEAMEATRAASSIEFSIQYGCALSLSALEWYRENKALAYAEELTVRGFVQTMRGGDEVSLECLGWFAKLMQEHTKMEKDLIIKLILKIMKESGEVAREAQAKGSKVSVENEWSGRWGDEMALRKLKEYLEV